MKSPVPIINVTSVTQKFSFAEFSSHLQPIIQENLVRGEQLNSLKKFIEGLPKAELHLHIEGSLEPEQMFEFAQRNQVDIPFSSVAQVRAAYEFSNLQDFLDIYYLGMNVLHTEQDFYELTMAYVTKVANENTKHVEIFFDPQGHTERGVAFATVVNGIKRALNDAESKFGITHKLIMCFLRHLSEASAIETLETAIPYLSVVDGVGLDSSELGHPPEKFSRVFRRASELGLKKVAHAGEEGPPEYVYQALDVIGVDRIDHGNRSLEDDVLVQRLVDERIALTVCPLSNLKLCVVDDLAGHPLKVMLDKGLMVTINSDDPSYFGGYINQNYLSVAQALSLSREELITCAKNSFTASFLSDSEIVFHHNEIDRYVASCST